eukprot:1155829-Pelagomonas_calceolata.AAC.2
MNVGVAPSETAENKYSYLLGKPIRPHQANKRSFFVAKCCATSDLVSDSGIVSENAEKSSPMVQKLVDIDSLKPDALLRRPLSTLITKIRHGRVHGASALGVLFSLIDEGSAFTA